MIALKNLFLTIIKRIKYHIIEPNYDAYNNEILCVLGNGPSLQDDMENLLVHSEKWDFFCVNQFSTFAEYRLLKPKNYVFLDNYYWDENLNEDLILKRDKAINKIIEDTSWPMSLWVPHEVKKKFLTMFQKNSNIKVLGYFMNSNFFRSKKINTLLLKYKIFAPAAAGVVHYAIWIGMNVGYKQIKIFGIDNDPFRSFDTYQETNVVYTGASYFRSENKEKPKIQKTYKTMSQRLNQVALGFSIFELLNEYSIIKDIKLTNCSSYSLVDSIDREKIELND